MYKVLVLFVLLTQVLAYKEPNIHFHIALKQENVNVLEKKLAEISNPDSIYYGNYMSIEEIQSIVSPPVNEVNPIIDWLESAGVTVINNGDDLQCDAPISVVNELFKVNMIEMPHNKKFDVIHYRSRTNYVIPDRFKDIIQFVTGISSPIYPHKLPLVTYHSIVDLGYVGRESAMKLYSIEDGTIHHSNVSAGAGEFQGGCGFSNSNLLKAQDLNDVHEEKITHIVGNPYNVPDLESQLDVEMISQTAAGVQEWYWDNQNWMYDFAVELVHRKVVPDTISLSWGWAEDQQCTIIQCTNTTSAQYISRTNVEFMKAGLRGVTLIAASGDAGSPGRTSESCLVSRPVNPVFPGSSPYLTSVGATFVVAANSSVHNDWHTPLCKQYRCSNGTQQLPINWAFTSWTTGGGMSIYSSEKLPDWQKDQVTGYLNSGVLLPEKFSRTGRGYPDVTMNGHNCPTMTEGGLMAIDGTSCSAPMFAGVVALLNDHQVGRGKPKLGFANPLLYKMQSTFLDVTKGNTSCTEEECCPVRSDGGSNFGFFATQGWDPVSGLGLPNVKKMLEWLDNNL